MESRACLDIELKRIDAERSAEMTKTQAEIDKGWYLLHCHWDRIRANRHEVYLKALRSMESAPEAELKEMEDAYDMQLGMMDEECERYAWERTSVNMQRLEDINVKYAWMSLVKEQEYESQ